MTRAPRIPGEDHSFTEHGPEAERNSGVMTDARSSEADPADPKGAAPDWFGDLRQNLTAHWKVQEH